MNEQFTIVISIVALLVSTSTAALNMFARNKRDHFNELDTICKQQWKEIDNLKAQYSESEGGREKLKAELQNVRLEHRRDVSVIKADMNTTSARVDTGVAVAKLAAIEASKASDAVIKVAEENAKGLAEIAETSKATHKIVNNQRTVMLRQVAVLSRLYAKDHPEDDSAQVAAEQAENDLRGASEV